MVDDRKLLADADAVMAAYEAVPVAEADRVLVHTDVGFHNLGIDPESHTVHASAPGPIATTTFVISRSTWTVTNY